VVRRVNLPVVPLLLPSAQIPPAWGRRETRTPTGFPTTTSILFSPRKSRLFARGVQSVRTLEIITSSGWSNIGKLVTGWNYCG